MKIQLKRFTTNARLSQETTAFAADVWVDGKKVGTAENDGRGGCTNVRIHDPRVRAAVEAHGKALVPAEYASFTSGAEWVVDQLVEAEVRAREDAKFAKRIAKVDAQNKEHARRAGKAIARFMHETARGEEWEYVTYAPGGDPAAAANALAAKRRPAIVVRQVVVL